MLKIIKKQLPVELNEEMASNLRQSLQARYNSLLHRVRLEYLNRLGLEPNSCDFMSTLKDSPLILGELFLPEAGTIFYIKAKRGEGLIQAGVITNDETRDTDEFFSEVRDIMSGICDNLPSWQISADLLPLEIEDAEVEPNPATEEQLAAAKMLMDRESRQLLEQIKNAGSIFLNKIECPDRDLLERRIHNFKDLGLLSMDYAVLCHRTGQQILRVADKATIDESSQKAFKCFICGSQISDELIEEVLACTECGVTMLSDRTWLLILVRGILAELGIPSSAMKIYRSKELPVQIFLSINGLRYLLVLCTEPITLDQAYLIGAHLAAYKLDSAIIISTEKITTLMRSHLEQTSPRAKFEFLDKMEDLSAHLQRIIIDQQRDFLSKQLEDMVSLTKVDISPLVLQRMLPIPENLKDVTVRDEPAASVHAEVSVSEAIKVSKPSLGKAALSIEPKSALNAETVVEIIEESGALEIPSKGSKKGKKH
ncbi:MAG: hypothetical protein ACI376_05725 [Candidatus Bruticola sp.]